MVIKNTAICDNRDHSLVFMSPTPFCHQVQEVEEEETYKSILELSEKAFNYKQSLLNKTDKLWQIQIHKLVPVKKRDKNNMKILFG